MILSDLCCNQTKLYHNHVLIWHNTSIVGKIQLPYINKSHDNHIIGKLKPPQDVITVEKDYPEEEIDLVHYYIK